jgi:hypothetical protein
MKKIIALMFTPALIALVSCGEPEDQNKPKDIEFTSDSINYQAQINIDLITVNFPSPTALGKKFKGAGISFVSGVLNPAGKSYGTKGQQAIALGAYGADLGFSCAFNQNQEANNYLMSIGKLSNELGVGSAFDMEFSKSLIESLGKADTQDVMIDKAFQKAERHMRSNERMQYAGLMAIGGWIEGLYAACEMVYPKKDEPATKPVYKEIWNYVTAYKYVKNLLEEYKANPDYQAIATEFAPLEGAFKAAADKNEFSAKHLDGLRTAIQTLRGKVIK